MGAANQQGGAGADQNDEPVPTPVPVAATWADGADPAPLVDGWDTVVDLVEFAALPSSWDKMLQLLPYIYRAVKKSCITFSQLDRHLLKIS